MSNTKELVQKYKDLLADSRINMEDVPYRSRSAMAIKRNDAIAFLPGVKKQLLTTLLETVDLKMVSGSLSDCENYAKQQQSNSLVIDSEELYAKVATQIWDSMGHSKTFGAHQMHVFLQITNSLVQDTFGQGSFSGLSDEKYVSSKRECFEHIKTLMESIGGLTLNKVYLENTIMQSLLDSVDQDVMTVSVINVPESELDAYSRLLFGKLASSHKLASTVQQVSRPKFNKKQQPPKEEVKVEEEES